MLALSVSISTSSAPRSTCSPSAISQRRIVPCSIVSESRGMTTSATLLASGVAAPLIGLARSPDQVECRRRRSSRRRSRSGGRDLARPLTGRSPSTPEQAIGTPLTAPRNASVCGWPSSTVTSGAARSRGKSSSRTRVVAAPSPDAPAARGRRDRRRSGRPRRRRRPRAVELVGGGQRLGHDRADRDERRPSGAPAHSRRR